MVFQGEVTNNLIWGFTDNPDVEVFVSVACVGKSGPQTTHLRADPSDFKPASRKADGDIWEVTYPNSQYNGDRCDITVEQETSIFTWSVIFGDLWFCSGQSNMDWTMANIFNATEEVANSASYTNIRMFAVSTQQSDVEENDLIGGHWDGWYTPDDASKLNQFSSVCFLFARSMTDRLSPAGETKRVFGLIDSNWGGTRIEAWMSQDALDACNIPPNNDGSANSNQVLWNAMVYPFLRHNIYGGLWYQGESNAGWNRDLYNCTFPAKINDWRDKWNGGFVPYGFVQIANFVGDGGVTIRWHQTADYGYTPNPSMENVFMAVAMDTYDEPSGIHPRYKQIVGERLSISGGNVAYGLSTPTNGPFPVTVTVVNNIADITYDQEFTYNNNEISGFYICCLEFDECTAGGGANWELLPKESVSGFMPGQATTKLKVNLALATQCGFDEIQNLAYLWEDNPIKEYLGAPIVANDEYKLPGAPWNIQKSS